jgi:hypothetical protein
MKGMSMPTENADDDGNPTSLRRALVFVLLGPVLAVLTVLSLMIALTGGPSDAYGYPIVFVFSLVICAIAAPIDGVLAYVVPVWARAHLIAIVGAAIALGLNLYLGFRSVPIAAVGALNTGACCVLTHCFRRRED